MGRFIAFKLKNGDSFYLETKIHNKKKSVLVDGGDGTEVTHYFKRVVGRDKVNIAVCTHKDRDHASGIKSILESITCDEVWLPAEWGDIFNHFISSTFSEVSALFDEFAAKLHKYEKEKNRRVSESVKFEKRVDDNNEHDNENLNDLIEFAIENDLSSPRISKPRRYTPKISQVDLNQKFIMMMLMPSISHSFHLVLSKEMSDRLIDIVGHYKNIISIAKKAIERNMKIRWFLYGENKTHRLKDDDPLIPLNSVEVFKMRRLHNDNVLLELLLQYKISPENQRSLVFSSRCDKKKTPPVLFTADSNLERQEVDKAIFKNGMIITTPHHGSFNNKPAFDEISKKIKTNRIVNTKWVRGFNRDVTLGNWYMSGILAIRGSTRRYCTNCESNHIQFRIKKGQWKQVHRKRIGDVCTCTSNTGI